MKHLPDSLVVGGLFFAASSHSLGISLCIAIGAACVRFVLLNR